MMGGKTPGWRVLAFLWPARRTSRIFAINVDQPGQEPRLIWERSVRDRYGNPGLPVLKTLPNGHEVLWQEDNSIFLAGAGATPKGDRPFLDRFDLVNLKAQRPFQ